MVAPRAEQPPLRKLRDLPSRGRALSTLRIEEDARIVRDLLVKEVHTRLGEQRERPLLLRIPTVNLNDHQLRAPRPQRGGDDLIISNEIGLMPVSSSATVFRPEPRLILARPDH